LQVSPNQGSHWKLPQHLPQSWGQLAQDSWGVHLPSPHLGGQGPQSIGQLVQLSLLSHLPLPQALVPQPPHWFLHSPTQMLSQALLQQ